MTRQRALGVVRLSVGNENQTGDETQTRRITKRADAEEMDLVHIARDIDVSASVSPWLRPELGDWLNNRKDEFDVLILLKVDRIARSVQHLSEILAWCKANGKGLISCEEGFDFSKPWGRTIATILAAIAEAELDAIQERIRASRETMRRHGRWPGGLVPFGRRAVKGDNGFTLELDPEYGPVLLEMVRRFVKLKSFSAVADWLDESKVPTTQDIARMRSAAGESTTRLVEAKPRGFKWSPGAVQSILTSKSLLGQYQRADGSVVMQDDGVTPVMRSVPVLTDEEWVSLQEAIQSVKYQKNRDTSSAWVGVPFCYHCKLPYYFNKAGDRNRRARYNCRGKRKLGMKPCPGSRIWSEDLDLTLRNGIIQAIGRFDVMEPVVRVDESKKVRLATIDGEMNLSLKDFQAGKIGANAYAAKISPLAAEREKLTATEGPKPVTEWVPIGKSYAQWWELSTIEERRAFLVKHGVRAEVDAASGKIWLLYGDLVENLRAQHEAHHDPIPPGAEIPEEMKAGMPKVDGIILTIESAPYSKPKKKPRGQPAAVTDMPRDQVACDDAAME